LFICCLDSEKRSDRSLTPASRDLDSIRPSTDARRARHNRGSALLIFQGIYMNDDTFNISLRKFLKMVGVSSQREIEQAVARARAAGEIDGSEKLPATMTLEVPGLKLSVKFEGKVELE